ncbi:LacI family DNA-binding transcriptional regulator [Dyadobacter sediminis]|uniref:LacI family transcriptional regulator n=1 Tax=Dyadobacter sediminis TaxID=1493691 RepID=A0A5R9KBH5_9BACT|nr:substrate-binding domain-containing protein [Dyadobacter sediminis]TLU92112.1 LacI family transcriptional regulator [Dyadobacter sediminis]GGB97327.1 LacI family transcriptional regulator [Dyadobacter sediminis]
MTDSKPSMSDLAKKLNVSKTTISFILNGKAKERRISEALVEKVLAEAANLGYRPNQFAQSLRTGRTNIIGLMVEDISNPFYASIARLIEEKVYQNGYRIVYCSTENDVTRGKDFLTMFSTLSVDGCIVAPTQGMEQEIREMHEKGKSVVLFDRYFGNDGTDAVMVDNQGGMYRAVEHLAARGAKDIGLIAIALDDPEKEDRIIGFKKAIADNGLATYVFPLPFKGGYEEYLQDISEIFSRNKLDAVVFGTNYLGIAGLEVINQMGLRIPDDMAMISFDDHDLFRIHRPGITVVAQPIEAIAQKAIDTLMSKLRNPALTKKTAEVITLPTSLIVRAST